MTISPVRARVQRSGRIPVEPYPLRECLEYIGWDDTWWAQTPMSRRNATYTEPSVGDPAPTNSRPFSTRPGAALA
jgi:hypothetical protein